MIQIFDAEIKDGLSDKINQNMSFAYQCLVSKDNLSYDTEEIKKSIAGHIESGRNYDLYHISSILASVGINKNDDVFLPEEIWAAKDTPIHKQVNFGHNEKDIVGAIIGSAVLDISGNKITDPIGIQNINDIVSHAVIWSKWEDEDLQERFNSIIEDIENNKLFVSMECLFKQFDYLLVKDETKSVVKRTKETSFLSKYLRILGGEGEYNGYKIYRILRNFTFSGKALVANPANARSIISDHLSEDSIDEEIKLKSEKSQASECCEDCEKDDDDYELVEGEYEDFEEDFSSVAEEEPKGNKKLNKPFRTPSGPKKFSVYVKNDKGNIVKVNFGDPNMSIKRDDPERRKSFRARHNCDNPGPKWKARYWSCKFWSTPSVTKLLAENIMDEVTLNAIKAELAAAKAELENFKKAEAEKVSAAINELKTQNDSLQKQVAELTQLAQAAKEDMEKTKTEAEKDKEMMKEECNTKLAEASTKVIALEAEKVTAERMSQLAAASVETAKAEEILKTWASASKEQFTEIVKLYASTKSNASEGTEKKEGFDLDPAKSTASVVNPNGDSGVDKAVAQEKALAEKIAAQFNFKKKEKGSK
jgi:hypothetical protein